MITNNTKKGESWKYPPQTAFPTLQNWQITFWRYLAGTDKERASDIMEMFNDTSVSFIIANRGGWGCNRIIDMVNDLFIFSYVYALFILFYSLISVKLVVRLWYYKRKSQADHGVQRSYGSFECYCHKDGHGYFSWVINWACECECEWEWVSGSGWCERRMEFGRKGEERGGRERREGKGRGRERGEGKRRRREGERGEKALAQEKAGGV